MDLRIDRMEFSDSSTSIAFLVRTKSTTTYRTHYHFIRDSFSVWCVFYKHKTFCIALHIIHILCWNRIKIYIFLEKVNAWKWNTEKGERDEWKKKTETNHHRMRVWAEPSRILSSCCYVKQSVLLVFIYIHSMHVQKFILAVWLVFCRLFITACDFFLFFWFHNPSFFSIASFSC